MEMEVGEEVVTTEEVELCEADYGMEETEVSQEGGETIIHLSAEDLESGTRRTNLADSDGMKSSPHVVNPRAHQKQYAQRYKHEWEKLEFTHGWLTPHRSNRLLAYCKVCQRALQARKNDLRKHARSSRHKENMDFFNRGISARRGLPRAQGIMNSPELAGWCQEMPGKPGRAWCRQCQCGLTAQLRALKVHSQSRKHQSNADQPPKSPPPAELDSPVVGGGLSLMEMEREGSPAGPSGYDSVDGGDGRAASPLLESDFAGRVTYSIGLGNRKVGFLGAGQISQAIAQGMLEQGLLLPNDVIVSAPTQRNMMQWKRWKCRTTNNNDEVVRESDIIFVAVKASVLVRMIGRLTPISDGKTRLFISLVPGVPRDRMTALLSCRVLPVGEEEEFKSEVTGAPLHVIRCAANKMMSISAGFCAYCMGEDVPHSLYLVVETMFSALGTCVQVEEYQMDAYCTMIASGAAFTCAFIEAMVQGGVSLDLGWDEALKVASGVVSGTSKLLMRTSIDPSTLRKSISTPGGSTIAGLAALQRGGLDDAVGRALTLACEKTKEVGEAVCGGGSGDTSTAAVNVTL